MAAAGSWACYSYDAQPVFLQEGSFLLTHQPLLGLVLDFLSIGQSLEAAPSHHRHFIDHYFLEQAILILITEFVRVSQLVLVRVGIGLAFQPQSFNRSIIVVNSVRLILYFGCWSPVKGSRTLPAPCSLHSRLSRIPAAPASLPSLHRPCR